MKTTGIVMYDALKANEHFEDAAIYKDVALQNFSFDDNGFLVAGTDGVSLVKVVDFMSEKTASAEANKLLLHATKLGLTKMIAAVKISSARLEIQVFVFAKAT